MMSLCLRLEARAPARRCHRAYEIVGGQDLFGAWLVEMRYGRIGSLGQSRTRSFGGVDEAVALVAACLRKRATAPRRIGVAYRLRRAVCGGGLAESRGRPAALPRSSRSGKLPRISIIMKDN